VVDIGQLRRFPMKMRRVQAPASLAGFHPSGYHHRVLSANFDTDDYIDRPSCFGVECCGCLLGNSSSATKIND
jgi:hypothetical protein